MIRKHGNKDTITGFARKDNWLNKRRSLCCFKCKSTEDVILPSSGDKDIAMCGKCLTSGKSTTWELRI